MKRLCLLALLAPVALCAQDFIEVRPAEPVGVAAEPEVRRAEAVAPSAPAGAVMPAIDVTDGTEAIRAAPSNRLNDPARQSFEQANAFYGQKMYDLAAPKYREFLATAPRGLDRQAALFRLGECSRAANRPAEAGAAYRQLLAEFNSGDFLGPAAYRLGEMQYGARDFEGAAATFRVAALHVRDANLRLAAKFFEGRALEAAGRKVEALSAYREVASIKEDNPYRERAILDLADADARAGLTDSALRQLRGLAETAQNPVVRTSAAVKAGLLAIDQRDFATARPLLEMGAANNELPIWKAAALAGLVRLDYESENYKGAATRAEEILPMLPADSRPDVLLLAANASRQMGDQARALALYDRLAAEYPNSSAAREAGFHRLVSLVARQDERALAQIDVFLMSSGDEGERATLRLLLSYYHLENREAAAGEATKLGTEKAPTEVREWLGLSSLEAGDYAMAVGFLAPLGAGPESSPELRTSLAQAQIGAKQMKAARATLDQLLPNVHEPRAKARAHLLMAEAMIGMKDGAAAKTQAEEAQRLQPEGRLNAEARLANGRALLAQNKFDDAARAFMAVALLYDEKDLTPQALALAEQAYRRADNTTDADRAREELQRRYPDYKTPAQS